MPAPTLSQAALRLEEVDLSLASLTDRQLQSLLTSVGAAAEIKLRKLGLQEPERVRQSNPEQRFFI